MECRKKFSIGEKCLKKDKLCFFFPIKNTFPIKNKISNKKYISHALQKKREINNQTLYATIPEIFNVFLSMWLLCNCRWMWQCEK